MTTALTPPEPHEDAPSSGQPGRPVWALSGDDLLSELDVLHVEASRLQTRRLALLARLDEIGCAKELGARDTIELLALRHRLDAHHVRRDLKLAKALPKYPAVHHALTHTPAPGPGLDPHPDTDDAGTGTDAGTDGDQDQPDQDQPVEAGVPGLHPGQAEAIVTSLERVPVTVPVEDLEVAEVEMVAAARVLSPGDLRRLGRGVVDRLDPDGREPLEGTARRHESLWFARSFDNTAVRFGGLLANENAELLITLVDACAAPKKTTTGELDPRTKDQRQADGLVQVLRAAAATGGDIPAHGGIRPHIAVTINLNDLIQAGKQHTGDLTFGHGLSAAAIRQLACDAGIIPVVLGSASQPLDVGREARTVTPAIRRALIARDQGCVIPGCNAPPGHCDAHHLQEWSLGGATSLDNSVLVCPPHHRSIHQGAWTIHIIDGTVTVTRPHWTQPDTTSGRSSTDQSPPERPPPQASESAANKPMI